MNATRPATRPAPVTVANLSQAALFVGVAPRAPRLPGDLAALESIAALSYCPVGSAERRDRSARIATMIASALAAG